MKGILNFTKQFAVLAVVFLTAYSCSEDSESVINEGELTSTELKTILETDDAASVVDSILAELYMNDSNSAKSNNECYGAEYTDTGFTVVFENCVLNGSDNVNGTLTVTYAVGQESATFTATYDAFYVGEIELNGTRSYSVDGNEAEGSFSFSVTSDMEVTMPNGDTIAENGTRTFGFAFGENLETSTFTIDGNWAVFHDGNSYAVEVTTTLEGNFSCGYLTSGSMDVNKNGLEVSVDFGDGSCDEMVTVIYPNGATEDVSIGD
ncbi:hypothetical protein [Muriicola sp. Z0-33]|uniref:hypothetical protein n=1 Tax=Muriicola sp. Z0-33 TaxID=2816957 RepID=UPI002238896D|nr:hypothetical protein [Muriicola sp. Z0-33]MCW5515243.1 hypothetical protein [Muriicola sp. Z0-33]